MTEFTSTHIPTEDSAPRGLNHPDNRDPLYTEAELTINPVAVEAALTAELGHAPNPAEVAARIGEIANQLVEQRIDEIIDQLEEEGGQTPLDVELGPVQYGFHQAERDRIPEVLPDPNPVVIGAPGTPILQQEANSVLQRLAQRELLTEDERRRLAEIYLSDTIINIHGVQVPNPSRENDPMLRMRYQTSLQSHITGLTPQRPWGPAGSIRRRIQERRDRLDQNIAIGYRTREQRAADQARTLSKGPEASSNHYGTGGLKERRDRISEEALSRNVFTRRGSVFRYEDNTTGTERHFVVEGALAKQAVYGTEPLFFINEDGSLSPLIADDFGNITNMPIQALGASLGSRSVTPNVPYHPGVPTEPSPHRIVTSAYRPIFIDDKTTLRTGREVVIFRPLFTQEERRTAHRDGALALASPGFGGDPECIVGPRYALVDDMVFASAASDNPNIPRPRAIERPRTILTKEGSKSSGRTRGAREEILEEEWVWQSDHEMTNEEFNDPDNHPPAIINGENESDNGRFVRWDGHNTMVVNSGDADERIPNGHIGIADRATFTYLQRRYLKDRDARTDRRNTIIRQRAT